MPDGLVRLRRGVGLDRLRGGEGGFGVVEVIVALSLLGVVAAAVLPVLVLSTKASVLARDRTQAKNLAAGRLEQLRTLPFFVARESQPAGSSLDLLDRHFPNTAAAAGPLVAATGYVALGASGVPAGEPTGGGYYRTHTAALPTPATRFSETVTVQFLRLDSTTVRTPVVPPPTYTSATTGQDTPATRLVEVRVLLRWTYGGQVHTERLVSQIADAGDARVNPGQAATGQSLLAQARSQALRVVDATSTDELSARLGTATADGAAGSASTAAASADAVSTGPFAGVTRRGAHTSVMAPPDATSLAGTGAAWTDGDTCVHACFGPSSAPAESALVNSGAPSAGGAGTPSASNPAVAVLARRGTCPSDACARSARPFAFNGRLQQVADRDLDYTVDDGYGAVTVVDPASGDAARGTAVVGSTAGTAGSVWSTATAVLSRVDVLPTRSLRAAGAGGLLRVELQSASLSCSASRTAQSAAAAYQGVLSYWGRLADGSYGYTSITFERSGSGFSTSGGLPDWSTVVLATSADGTVTRRLSDYVQNVTVANAPTTAVEGGTRTVRSSVTPVRIVSAPLGATGTESTLSLDVGALSCIAQDAR